MPQTGHRSFGPGLRRRLGGGEHNPAASQQANNRRDEETPHPFCCSIIFLRRSARFLRMRLTSFAMSV